MNAAPVLAVEGLRAYYQTSHFGVEREVRAVDDVSLAIPAGEIYGLAGESSSGKTTLIKTIANAIQPPLQVLAGRGAASVATDAISRFLPCGSAGCADRCTRSSRSRAGRG